MSEAQHTELAYALAFALRLHDPTQHRSGIDALIELVWAGEWGLAMEGTLVQAVEWDIPLPQELINRIETLTALMGDSDEEDARTFAESVQAMVEMVATTDHGGDAALEQARQWERWQLGRATAVCDYLRTAGVFTPTTEPTYPSWNGLPFLPGSQVAQLAEPIQEGLRQAQHRVDESIGYDPDLGLFVRP